MQHSFTSIHRNWEDWMDRGEGEVPILVPPPPQGFKRLLPQGSNLWTSLAQQKSVQPMPGIEPEATAIPIRPLKFNMHIENIMGSIMRMAFHRRCSFILFSYLISVMAHWDSVPSAVLIHLQCSFICSGHSSAVLIHLQCSFICSAHSSAVLIHLQWSFICSAHSSAVLLHLQW